MPYCSSFSDFESAAKQLWSSKKSSTRLLLHYKATGKLIFKVTDDISSFQFQTDQHADLKNFEKLNGELMNIAAS